MKFFKYVLVLCTSCFITGSAHAQDLNGEEKSYFEIRVKQTVEEFQHALSNIANNDLRHDIRKESVNSLLKLFIGEGEPYDYYDEELDRRVHSLGVNMRIQTTNLSKSQRLKRYIYKLYNPETRKSSMPFSRIALESADIIRIDNIQKVGDHYECIAYYTQKFIGLMDGGVVFSDRTIKKIRCYMKYDTSVTLPPDKKIFQVLLGDIYVVSSHKNVLK